MNENYYDVLVIFPAPLYLPLRGNTDRVNVYGILFKRENTLPKNIDDYVGYLHGCHNFLKNGGKIEDGKWISDGCVGEDTSSLRKFVSMVQDKNYEVIISDEPIEIQEAETDEDWVISKELIERTMKDLPR